MKYPFMLALMALCHFANGQPKEDSITCVPTVQLRNAIKKNEELKIVKEEAVVKDSMITVLSRRVKLKDSLIGVQDSIVKVQKKSLVNFEQIKKDLIYSELNTRFERDSFMEKFKKQKGFTWKIGVAALVAGFSAAKIFK